MKFLKPLLNNSSKKISSFGQKRAQKMNNQLSKTQNERKKLIQKQYLSPDPLNKVYEHKGNQLDVKIRKLQDKN